MEIEKRFIQVGDIRLHVVFAGPENGAPVVLLHGFPEFWYGWKNQIPFLAEQGFRVIVPDQRGYNLSDKPAGIAAYRLDLLAKDIIGLLDILGYEQVFLAGHDWGAAVAWTIAETYPQRLKRLMILNVPHPRIMARELRSGNLQQLRKSWYMMFFQIPSLPEKMLAANDYRNMIRGMLGIGTKGSFSRDDFEPYKQAWQQPGAVTAMLNWYRAAVRGGSGSRTTRIMVPTMILWGEKDKALGRDLAEKSLAVCADGELIFFPEASHWIQHDKPDDVNRYMAQFFR